MHMPVYELPSFHNLCRVGRIGFKIYLPSPSHLVRSSTWSERSFLSADARARAPAAPRRWFPAKRRRRTPDAGGGTLGTTPRPSPPACFAASDGGSRSAPLAMESGKEGASPLSIGAATPAASAAFAAAALLRSAEEMDLVRRHRTAVGPRSPERVIKSAAGDRCVFVCRWFA